VQARFRSVWAAAAPSAPTEYAQQAQPLLASMGLYHVARAVATMGVLPSSCPACVQRLLRTAPVVCGRACLLPVVCLPPSLSCACGLLPQCCAAAVAAGAVPLAHQTATDDDVELERRYARSAALESEAELSGAGANAVDTEQEGA